MLKIGFLKDKKNNSVFILPSDLRQIKNKNLFFLFPQSYGKRIKINDQEYKQNNSQILGNNRTIIKEADIVIKINPFTKKECKILTNKIWISLTNFTEHVKMLYWMIKYNNIGCSWQLINNNNDYFLFNEIEKLKNNYVVSCIEKFKKITKLSNKKHFLPAVNDNCYMIINLTPASLIFIKSLIKQNKKLVIFNDPTVMSINYQTLQLFEQEIKNQQNVILLKNDYDNIKQYLPQCNYVINYLQAPNIKNKKYIFKTMLKAIATNTLFIDTGVENNFAYDFNKDKKSTIKKTFIRYKNFFFCNLPNIASMYPLELSQIISKNSIALLNMLKDNNSFINNSELNKTLIVYKQKILNKYTKLALSL